MTVIDGCAKSGDKEKAVEWLSNAQEASLKPNIITYMAVIDACSKSGYMECLAKVQEAWLKPDIITYCAKSGDKEKDVVWLSNAREAGLKPNIIAYVADMMPARRLATWRMLSSAYPRCRRLA